MVVSKYIASLFLALAFATNFVRGSKEKARYNLSKEQGLTPACVHRVLQSCGVLQSHLNTNAHTASDVTIGLLNEETTAGQKSLLRLLNEYLDTNKLQEEALQQMKGSIQSLEEVVSQPVSDVQSLKEIVSKTVSDFQSLRDTTKETIIKLFKELESIKVVSENSFKEIKAQRKLLEDVQKTALSVEQIKENLKNVELKLADRDISVSQISNDLQHLKKSQELIIEQDLSPSLTQLKDLILDSNEQQKIIFNITKILLDGIKLPHDCADHLKRGDRESGIRTVYPFASSKNRSISVFCDQETDNGGWTVFLNRDALPVREDFFRGWEDYRHGFGNITGEFWLGLDNIHALVSGTPTELRVDLEDFEGDKRWAKYNSFSIGDAASKYKLHVEGYSGDAGDSLKVHNGQMFYTKDQDRHGCAKSYMGAWWYAKCYDSNLNGYQFEGILNKTVKGKGISWFAFRGSLYSLKRAVMKVRSKAQCNP